ncbi:hypothetical protein PIB30_097118, partial [Stylosanthes scabra]|nr:hypothetical protein [Stylosanthes scabra]
MQVFGWVLKRADADGQNLERCGVDLQGHSDTQVNVIFKREFLKIEERKLADQETEFGSKTEQGSTHMHGRARICVLLIPQPTP